MASQVAAEGDRHEQKRSSKEFSRLVPKEFTVFGRNKPLKDKVKDLKKGPEYRYFALSLREDLSELIYRAISRKQGMTQRKLAEIAGYRSESYISRLVNAATDFKIGVAARVLLPLGIVPRLVDGAEWDRLKEIANQIESRRSDSLIVSVGTQGAVEYVSTSQQARSDFGPNRNGADQCRFTTASSRTSDTVGRLGRSLVASGSGSVHTTVVCGRSSR